MYAQIKLEDDIIFFANGLRPPLFYKWKTTSILFANGRLHQVFQMEDDLIFLKMEGNNLIFLVDIRQP